MNSRKKLKAVAVRNPSVSQQDILAIMTKLADFVVCRLGMRCQHLKNTNLPIDLHVHIAYFKCVFSLGKNPIHIAYLAYIDYW